MAAMAEAWKMNVNAKITGILSSNPRRPGEVKTWAGSNHGEVIQELYIDKSLRGEWQIFQFGIVPMNRQTWGQETIVPWIPNKSGPTWSATLDVKLGRRWGGVIRGGGIHCHGVITIFSNPEGKLKKSILISGACTRMSNRCTRFPTSAGSHGTTGVRQTTLNSFNN